jgi:tetratricopeptide (TPR) repeat protein
MVLIYFGSFLPLKKSQLYIDAVKGSSQIKSVQEFNKLFGKALDFYSPIGHGEAVYAYLNVIIGVVQNQQNKEIIDILLKEADKRMGPILEQDKGNAFFQSLQSYGLLYELAGNKFNDRNYYQKAADIYEIALRHSPGRPNLLTGLFRSYNALGDTEKIKEIAEIINKYWPSVDNSPK